jgi:hypothetical protein
MGAHEPSASTTGDGSTVTGALIGCVVATPAALRLGSAEVSLVLAWLALAGGGALWLAPLAWGLRDVRGWRAVGMVVAGLALSSLPIAMAARVLKASTHHRPLGAATLAVVALVLVLAALWLASALLSERYGRAVKVGVSAAAVVSLLATTALALPVLPTGVARGVLVDVTSCFGLLALAQWFELPRRLAAVPAPLARYGWLGLALAGVVVLVSASPLPHVLAEHSPVPAFPVLVSLGVF